MAESGWRWNACIELGALQFHLALALQEGLSTEHPSAFCLRAFSGCLGTHIPCTEATRSPVESVHAQKLVDEQYIFLESQWGESEVWSTYHTYQRSLRD
jgi:hypothetical protein